MTEGRLFRSALWIVTIWMNGIIESCSKLTAWKQDGMLRLQEFYRYFLTLQVRLKGIEIHSKVQVGSVQVLKSPPKERMLTRGAGYSDCSLCKKSDQYVLAASSITGKTTVQVFAYLISGESIILQWEHWEEELFVDFNLQLGSLKPMVKKWRQLVCNLNSIMFLLSRYIRFSMPYQYDKKGK